MQYAIYYKWKGEYYTYLPGVVYHRQETAMKWFDFCCSYDKIIAIWRISPK